MRPGPRRFYSVRQAYIIKMYYAYYHEDREMLMVVKNVVKNKNM